MFEREIRRVVVSRRWRGALVAAACVCAINLAAANADAQTESGVTTKASDAPLTPKERAPEYAIGAEDVLGILVWREEELSLDVIVRPDGYISMPLVNDVLASGKTPTELKQHLQQLLRVYVKDPNVTVIVKQINSRKVTITGRVFKPGTYPILGPMRALDLVAQAGGLAPTADARHLSVLRTERGSRISLPIDYLDVTRGLRPWQDVLLRPGDTIVVP